MAGDAVTHRKVPLAWQDKLHVSSTETTQRPPSRFVWALNDSLTLGSKRRVCGCSDTERGKGQAEAHPVPPGQRRAGGWVLPEPRAAAVSTAGTAGTVREKVHFRAPYFKIVLSESAPQPRAVSGAERT